MWTSCTALYSGMQSLREAVAHNILENWADSLPRFIKIFPHEFKRVLGVTRSRQQYIPGQPLLVPELAEALHG